MFLLLVLLGYGLRRGGVLTDETTAWLARLVALAPLPALVLSALAKASFSPTLLGAWGVAMLSVWLGMGLAWLLGNLLPLAPPTRALLIVQGSISNTGFLGTPLIAALYSHEPNIVAAAVAYDMGVTSLMIHIGGRADAGACGRGEGRFRRGERAATARADACVLGGDCGLRADACGAAPARTAAVHARTAGADHDAAGATNNRRDAPLAHAGHALEGGRADCRLQNARDAAADAGAAALAGLPPFAAQALLLQSAMPTVMVSAVYAAAFRTEPELASAVVVASTVVALALLPLWMSAL
jgi:predicted permease